MSFYINLTNDPTMKVGSQLPLFPFPPPSLILSLLLTLSVFFRLSQGVLGLTSSLPTTTFLWFRSLLVLEAVFQLPTFFLGAWGLYKNDRRVWPLLVIYGASTATTLIPVLAGVLAAPGVAAGGKKQQIEGSLTMEQRGMLLASYLPFLFLPVSRRSACDWESDALADPAA